MTRAKRTRDFERASAAALAAAALLFVFASGCGPSKGVAKAPDAKAAPAATAVPPCPDAILPGGDPLEAESFEGKPVVRVCVLGGTPASREAAQKHIDLKPKDTFSAARVRADLEGILALGTFDDASAYGLRVQQGASVVLYYSVHDRPLVAAIGFEGSKVLGNAALDAKLPVQKNAPFDPVAITAVAQSVREEYRSRGYQACEVKLVTEPAPGSPPQVRVRIEVTEGPQWHYASVAFKGNKKVPEAELRKAAQLEVGRPALPDELERAGLLLSALYYDRGFVQSHIDADTAAPDATGALPLTFVIDEGEVHTIGGLHATKLGALVEGELLEKVVKARKKQVFSRSALVQDIQRVQAFFEGRGQHVEVLPLTEIDPKKNTVDLTFQIEAR